MDQILLVLQYGVECVYSKISTAVRNYEFVYKKLDAKVKLESNNKAISVPYSSKNTAGVYQNLKICIQSHFLLFAIECCLN